MEEEGARMVKRENRRRAMRWTREICDPEGRSESTNRPAGVRPISSTLLLILNTHCNGVQPLGGWEDGGGEVED